MKSPILALIDGTNLTHATYHALGGAGRRRPSYLKRSVDASTPSPE